jgi:hypothetical protein
MRSMVIAASYISKNLWPYAARYAVELLNHTPTKAVVDSKTLNQVRLELMGLANPVPNLYSFCCYSEVGWMHKAQQRRVQGAKFNERAVKTFYVGREGSRIYLM